MSQEVELGDYTYHGKGGYAFDNHIIDQSENKVKADVSHEKFSLVIPAYNEEKRITPFLKHLSKELPLDWNVVIVCDGVDKTAEIARSIDSRFRVLEFDQKLGKGGAIIEGFKAADGSVIGYVDADGALTFAEIDKVFSSISSDLDVAVASRWVNGSVVNVRQPLVRIFLGRVYHYMSFALLGLRIKDTQCGLKAFKADTLRKTLPEVTLKNLSFDTALLYHCSKLGAKVVEVPVTWKDVGESKVRPFKTALVMLFSLIGIRLAHSKSSDKLVVLMNSVRDLFENA